jgi:hypothetical protein
MVVVADTRVLLFDEVAPHPVQVPTDLIAVCMREVSHVAEALDVAEEATMEVSTEA